MDKGSNDFDMNDFFQKQKAASANNQFKQNTDSGAKKGSTPPPGTKLGQPNQPAVSKDTKGEPPPFEIDKETEEKILELVNTFISLANKQAEEGSLPINIISDAFLYAAARYNAFLVASADQKSIATNQEEYMKAFMEQYKAMLKDHFDFYKNNPL